MVPPRLILASSSPRRSELLRELGLPFEVRPGMAEELHGEHLTAAELCRGNAARKARSIAEQYPDAIVLGADTLVTLGGFHLGKPRDGEDAVRMLRSLAGRTHQVITGVALMHLAARRGNGFAEVTDVTFRELSEEEIREYIRLVPVLDKAGAYAIQDRGELLVAQVSGSFSNVIGLPIERLADCFAEWDLVTPPERDKIVERQKSRGLQT